MKKNVSRILGVFSGIWLLFSCTPDDYTYRDNRDMDVSSVDSVALVANHVMVLADGHAQLELFPKLFTQEGNQIPDSRVKDEWLEYVSESGIRLSRYFSTSDASLIGQTVTARLKIKGTDLESNPVTFEVIAPLETEYTSEIIIPVVFHIVQTTEDVESFGGEYKQEQIEALLMKLNNMLDGSTTHNPVGVNTHIRLKPALYDPYGKKLMEPGIDRLTVREINVENRYEDFLVGQHLIWPVEHYMNVWLISDREMDVDDFGNKISALCYPYYVNLGEENAPEGIAWKEYDGSELSAREAGVIYKLQELDNIDREFSNSGGLANNELGYYIGQYLGLLPTCHLYGVGTDFCDDTHDYGPDENAVDKNRQWYKEANGCYFRAENIMDDPRGGHCSVSREQCIRMRWVLNYCPGRSAWKSDFAFTGK